MKEIEESIVVWEIKKSILDKEVDRFVYEHKLYEEAKNFKSMHPEIIEVFKKLVEEEVSQWPDLLVKAIEKVSADLGLIKKTQKQYEVLIRGTMNTNAASENEAEDKVRQMLKSGEIKNMTLDVEHAEVMY